MVEESGAGVKEGAAEAEDSAGDAEQRGSGATAEAMPAWAGVVPDVRLGGGRWTQAPSSWTLE